MAAEPAQEDRPLEPAPRRRRKPSGFPVEAVGVGLVGLFSLWLAVSLAFSRERRSPPRSPSPAPSATPPRRPLTVAEFQAQEAARKAAAEGSPAATSDHGRRADETGD